MKIFLPNKLVKIIVGTHQSNKTKCTIGEFVPLNKSLPATFKCRRAKPNRRLVGMYIVT